MGWLFGKKKNINESIETMNTHTNTLDKRQRVLEKKIEQETAKAKEYMKKGNKVSAKMCLKRKKNYESQITKLQNQMNNSETMSLKMEEAVTDMETLKAQKQAAKNLKKIYGNTNVDKIERDMDKVRDTLDDANEISQALGQSLDPMMDDDEDLMDELNDLEGEVLDEQQMDMKKTPSHKVGNVPVASKTTAKVEEEDDELAALEAELNA